MNWLSKLIMLDDADPRGEVGAELDAPPFPTGLAGLPIRCFLLLLDYSGSMQDADFPPSRIAAACKAVRETVECLKSRSPRSYVGIGTFADRFHLCTNPLPVGTDARRIIDSLKDLGEVGSTNMHKGLEGILQIIRRCPKEVPVTITLLTDGRHTGRKRPLTSVVETLKAEGADIWAIGIGARPRDVGEELLKQIVSRPEQYIFIGNWAGPEAIAKEFKRIAGLYMLDEE